ncbi:MAG: amidohydrolase family protein [Planctomycetota bacterium]
MSDHTTATKTRARWILPVSGPPIRDGIIQIRGGSVEEVRAHVSGEFVDDDLGDVCLMPSLVNAHTHLEFSDCREPVGQPGMDLADWIAEAVSHRRSAGTSEWTGADSVAESIRLGIQEATSTGTRVIGEIATTPWPVEPTQASESSMVVMPFAEVLGLTPQRGQDRFDAAQSHLDSYPEASGLSPHAPYSTPLALVQRCVDSSRRRHCGVAMHVAESESELELLATGRGPFADRLGAMGIDHSAWFPHSRRDYIEQLIAILGEAPRAMLVHGNYLLPSQIELIAQKPQLSVVICPRTHGYFQHSPHPIDALRAAGVRVAIGTDSRASNPDLSLWGEVQYLLKSRVDLNPADVLAMATVDGHRAVLGCDGGGLTPGQPAVINALPTKATTIDQLYADMSEHVVTPWRAKDINTEDCWRP